MKIDIEFPSLINGEKIIQKINLNSSIEEQVSKLFHYSDNGSLQIIPVTLTANIDNKAKSIIIFVSTLSEKTGSYKKSINKRDKEKVPKVYTYYGDDPRFNSDDPVYDKSLLRKETFIQKVGRNIREFIETL